MKSKYILYYFILFYEMRINFDYLLVISLYVQ